MPPTGRRSTPRPPQPALLEPEGIPALDDPQDEAGAPLAARLRPRTLDEYVGQEHLIGPGKLLRRLIESGQLPSIILWGPPGSGKTTLARIIAAHARAHFVAISAVAAGVADLRRVVAEARARRLAGNTDSAKTILFIDEIHRFNKAQQDAVLPYVEDGTVTLIGATTENPSFEVIGPLLSRSRVFTLKALDEKQLEAIIRRALIDPHRGLGTLNLQMDNDAIEALAASTGGDARIALNALEAAAMSVAATPQLARAAHPGQSPVRPEPVEGQQKASAASDPASPSDSKAPLSHQSEGSHAPQAHPERLPNNPEGSHPPTAHPEQPDSSLTRAAGREGSHAPTAHPERPDRVITRSIIEEALQHRTYLYDQHGDNHYDTISAYIKSLRGSDPDASLYWLARMLEAGEDPLFIVRRLVILAAEDIGLADPNALLIATACQQAVHFIGMPEGHLPLAETTIYLALAPKSNSALTAYQRALADVEATRNDPVPLHLRNAVTGLMHNLGYGRDYKYAHNYQGNIAPDQTYLPERLVGHHYYEPGASQQSQ